MVAGCWLPAAETLVIVSDLLGTGQLATGKIEDGYWLGDELLQLFIGFNVADFLT